MAWITTLLLLGSGCGPQASENEYEARIRRTSYGVAHIEARDLANLGFGKGYAHAEDHACTVADLIVVVRGERAKILWPRREQRPSARRYRD